MDCFTWNLLSLPCYSRHLVCDELKVYKGIINLLNRFILNSFLPNWTVCSLFWNWVPWCLSCNIAYVCLSILDCSDLNWDHTWAKKYLWCQVLFKRDYWKNWKLILVGIIWAFYGGLGLVGLWYFYTDCKLPFNRRSFCINNHAQYRTYDVYDPCWV